MAFKRSGVRLPLAPPNLLQKSPGSPGLFAFRTARPHFARKIVGSRRRSNRCPARPNRRATRGRDGAHCASRARTWASSPAYSRGRPRFSVSSMRAFIHGRFDLARSVDRARPVAVQDDRNLRPGRMAPGSCRVLGIGWAPSSSGPLRACSNGFASIDASGFPRASIEVLIDGARRAASDRKFAPAQLGDQSRGAVAHRRAEAGPNSPAPFRVVRRRGRELPTKAGRSRRVMSAAVAVAPTGGGRGRRWNAAERGRARRRHRRRAPSVRRLRW